jgi:hypothetical protein
MVISRFLVVIGEIGGTFRRLMVSSSLDNSVVDFLAFFSFTSFFAFTGACIETFQLFISHMQAHIVLGQ